MSGKHRPGLPVYAMSFFGRIADLIDKEPLQKRDMEIKGLLTSIGIEKGQPFKPTGKVKKALEQAAIDGYAYLEYMFENSGRLFRYYGPAQGFFGRSFGLPAIEKIE